MKNQALGHIPLFSFKLLKIKVILTMLAISGNYWDRPKCIFVKILNLEKSARLKCCYQRCVASL